MKLLVIVLCLLSERFLVHKSSHKRFHWYMTYGQAMGGRLSQLSFLSSPWVLLTLMLLPLLLSSLLVFCLFSSLIFGFVGLLLNVIVFYYCIGPANPFYAAHPEAEEQLGDDEIGGYLAEVNGQLFAVVFWYILLGPVGVLTYRLVSLSQSISAVSREASWLTNNLDWLPARMTVLLYMLVGNFQAGLRYFSKSFFFVPANNQMLLSVCGLQALGNTAEGDVVMPHAENLVEHAVIVLLVLLAFFTFVAWV